MAADRKVLDVCACVCVCVCEEGKRKLHFDRSTTQGACTIDDCMPLNTRMQVASVSGYKHMHSNAPWSTKKGSNMPYTGVGQLRLGQKCDGTKAQQSHPEKNLNALAINCIL